MTGVGRRPFLGSEARAGGLLSWYELGRYYTALFPDVYLDKRVAATLADRIVAAWLWSRRHAVIAGAAAAALHGARWVDADTDVELIWRNARAPEGVVTRADALLDGEVRRLRGLPVTTVERTAFDLGRRGSLVAAVARLDALANATHVDADDVRRLAGQHPGARGLRQLHCALDLTDGKAQSPRESRLRLLLIDAGFPPPRTQIPVLGADGYPRYYLDMGWEDIMLAVEYDGEQHRVSREQFRKDVERAEFLHRRGWTLIRVLADHRDSEIVWRVRRARAALTLR